MASMADRGRERTKASEGKDNRHAVSLACLPLALHGSHVKQRLEDGCVLADSGLCAQTPCDSPQKALTTLPSAPSVLCLQKGMAAGDGPGAFTSLPVPPHLSEVTQFRSLTPSLKNTHSRTAMVKCSHTVLPTIEMYFPTA